MSRCMRKQCFNYLGKIVLLGIAICVLMAFLGPCLTTQISGTDTGENVRRIQNGRWSNAIIPDHEMGIEGLSQQRGRSAIDDVVIATRKHPRSNYAIKDQSHKLRNLRPNSTNDQNHKLRNQRPNSATNDQNNSQNQSRNKNVPVDNNLSNHDKNKTKFVPGQNASPQDKSSDVALNKTLRGHNVTRLDDIFIGVKTGGVYHDKRLDLLLETWVSTAKNQTFLFTDTDDDEYEKKTRGHLINTHCGHDHSRKALCCKMGVMFDTYVKKDKRWFCHFDDDNYLNTRNLVLYLQQYNPEKEDIYVGFTQLMKPITTNDKKRPGQQFKFYFGTGGAGFCISNALTNKMIPYMCNGSFIDVCDRIRWPDDMAIGFVIEILVNSSLIIEDRFNSHIQALGNIRPEYLANQITLSYKIDKKFHNTIHLPNGVFNTSVDPTRFRSLHCMLYPDAKGCPMHDL